MSEPRDRAILTAEIPEDLMQRLNRVTERKAPLIGLSPNRARSAILRQLLIATLPALEAELGLNDERQGLSAVV